MVMKKLKSDKRYCKPNYLDSKNKNGTKKDFYTTEVVDAALAEYERLEADL